MLMLSDFCFYKDRRDLWSAGCGSEGIESSNECSFGDPEKEWSVKVPVGSILYFTK